MQKYPATAVLNTLDAVDRGMAALLAPAGPAIDRSPLSPANKQALKTRPIGWLLGVFDEPVRYMAEDIVRFATEYSGVNVYVFQFPGKRFEARMNLDWTGDEVYSPDALAIVRNLRTVTAYMVLSARNLRALGVGWGKALMKRGKNAVEMVSMALAFAAQMAQSGWSSAKSQDFIQGAREAAGSGAASARDAIKTGAQNVVDTVKDLFRVGGLGEPVSGAAAAGIIAGLVSASATAFATAGTVTTAMITALSKLHTEATQMALATASAKERQDFAAKGILSAGMTVDPRTAKSTDFIPGIPNLALAAGAAGLFYVLRR